MVEEEIVQLVRTYDILGHLRNLAILRRQQFRADGRIDDIDQHLFQRRVRLARKVAQHRADEGFRHIGVDAVVGHVIAVKGRKSQRELAEVSRADDESTVHVGKIHQHLRTLARLRVFKRRIVDIHRVPDLFEVLLDALADVDLLHGDAERVAELFRVRAGTGAGAKARHRHRNDVLRGTLQQRQRFFADDQREGGVHAAGDADEQLLRVRMLDALGKAVALNREHLIKPRGRTRAGIRHERRFPKRARELGFADVHRKRNAYDVRVVKELSCKAPALAGEELQIDFTHAIARPEWLRFREHGAVFTDHVVTGKDHVRGAFARTRAAEHIRGVGAGALALHEQTPVVHLCDRLVARAEVQEDAGAAVREQCGRRNGSPEVFADLHADVEERHLAAAEHEAVAKRCLLPEELHLLDGFQGCGIGALFVKLAVVAKVRLGNYAQHTSVLHDSRAVIQQMPEDDRNADGDEHIAARGCARDALQRAHCGIRQRGAQHKVSAGVANDGQLRQHQHLDAVRLRAVKESYDRVRIVFAVGNLNFGRARRDLDKSVFHECIFSVRLGSSEWIPGKLSFFLMIILCNRRGSVNQRRA